MGRTKLVETWWLQFFLVTWLYLLGPSLFSERKTFRLYPVYIMTVECFRFPRYVLKFNVIKEQA